MAGGRGRRLMPLTENVPKPMLPIHGKPILEKIIDKAKIEIQIILYFGQLSLTSNN